MLHGLIGAWGGAAIVLLYFIAIGTQNASLIDSRTPHEVLGGAIFGAVVGFLVGWLASQGARRVETLEDDQPE